MIDEQLVKGMIEHWLTTPPNSYYGLSYGADIMPLLMQPLSMLVADSFMAKMKTDIPVLQKLSADALSLRAENIGFDKKMIYIQLGTILIEMGESIQTETTTGGTFDANAK